MTNLVEMGKQAKQAAFILAQCSEKEKITPYCALRNN